MFLISKKLNKFVKNYFKTCAKKVIDFYPHALEYVPDCYMSKEICSKAVNTYPFALRHGSSCYKIQKMCEKAVDTCPVMLECVPNCYKIQEMSAKAFFKESFMLNNCLQYKSREICREVGNSCLTLLQFVPD